MPFLPILDIAVGLSFLYLLLALLCTTLNETIASWGGLRSTTLEKGMERLLGDTKLKDAVYAHALIKNLATSDKAKPSYIPSDKFALALMDIITGPQHAASDGSALRQGLTGEINANLKQGLGVALESQDPDLPTDQDKIEKWFNDHMDRVGGWYKRAAQNRVLILAFVVTIVLNADTFQTTRLLWTNPAVSAAVVEQAKHRIAKGAPDADPQPMIKYDNPNDPTASTAINLPERDTLDDDDKKILGELTGWGDDQIGSWMKANPSSGFWAWFGFVLYKHGLGWLVTILAVSLGAPFWFDALNRFMNIRGAGRAPDEPRDKSTGTTVK